MCGRSSTWVPLVSRSVALFGVVAQAHDLAPDLAAEAEISAASVTRTAVAARAGRELEAVAAAADLVDLASARARAAVEGARVEIEAAAVALVAAR